MAAITRSASGSPFSEWELVSSDEPLVLVLEETETPPPPPLTIPRDNVVPVQENPFRNEAIQMALEWERSNIDKMIAIAKRHNDQQFESFLTTLRKRSCGNR